jgi:SNF2 family DNA or RNA helicase
MMEAPCYVSYDEAAGAWLLETDDGDLADMIHYNEGWGRTNRGGTLPPGTSCVYTKEPYAALSRIASTVEGSRARELLLPHLHRYRQSLATSTEDFEPVVPDSLPDWLEPMEFQKAGVQRCVELPHALLGDDMGVGKTAQGIMVANTIGAERVLVGTPANARSQWVESIKTWSAIPGIYRRVSAIERSADGVNPKASYTVVSYDLLRSPGIYAALMKEHFDLFIADEAHMLKTVDSARSQAAFGSLDGSIEGVASRSAKLLPMTGTPLPNRPRECYNLVRHTCWDAIDWLSEDAFIKRYNPSGEYMNGGVWEEHARGPELRARLRCNVMVRRKKRAVLTQLPEERHEVLRLDPDGDIREALKAEVLSGINVDDLETGGSFSDQGHVATVRRMMGVAMTKRVIEHVRTLMDGGLPKLFIACYHREVMDKLADKLASYGVVQIRGGQTPRQRDREKMAFIQDPAQQIMLGQFEASGQALDGLQAVCSFGLFAEPSWVHKDNVQIAGRLIRNGQKNGTLWQYCVAPGSLTEKILGKSIVKGQVVDQFLDG